MATEVDTSQRRETFSTRWVFILAAIGSAVGLGNIWRFPYVAFENGGGAFLVPYIIALLTAGIPLLFLDYALGHRYRGSAPLVFRRIKKWSEPIGWIQVGICFFITIYYAAIIAWAGLYTVKSFNRVWGDDPNTYFFESFLRMDASATFSFDYVGEIVIALAFVWIAAIIVLAMGVDSGIGRISKIFMPLLTVLFIVVVVRALFLDGASNGLNTFFTPQWEALGDASVWIAAYGQIFFSLSVSFGIMLTYSSYLKPRTNLTGTGLVTAFANSSFEVLAGIGVFAALGFMAVQQGVSVEDTASGGIGLAFIAFPTIINEMPLGGLFGVLFFGSLTIAGFTSLFSLFEVVVSAVKDKLNMPRKRAALSVGIVMATLSVLLFSTTGGLIHLDIMDKFTNNIGIVLIALIIIVCYDWILRRIDEVSAHLNVVSSFKVGVLWRISIVNLTAIVLSYTLAKELLDLIKEPYGGYTTIQVALYGWGVLGFIFVASIAMSFITWPSKLPLDGPPGSDFGIAPELNRIPQIPKQFDPRESRVAGFAIEQYK
ncbi:MULTISPECIES: sodium-dependent transporter [unclassified Corynebacterium]|uniref:sodium-dependent transporter n=1 Tax=unclassified Corynebacterium TaxID=2624378 RepID=UPI00216A0C81|nr:MULTISPECIES: sodium-dependent transporter [unclassified Corynebacterium]MCS4489921.1 sodium-dependent transporter [Corynebacterium sp. ES2775-CONJ]MCS4491716.1 sodium-dependent transporter [Corynebacterium sp. ES2715-CONJ3]MCS4531821.1 sodium-dependent transporter [Corynebacterium sp. ES2730-CONJ]